MKRLLTALALAAASVTVAAAPAAGPASALAPCKDSNGTAPGGSVYWGYSIPMTCDVSPPQRLHLTQTPTLAACNHNGGHGWTNTYRICWDVDY